MARSVLNADAIEFHKIMLWIRTIMIDMNKTKFRTFELNRFFKCNQAYNGVMLNSQLKRN